MHTPILSICIPTYNRAHYLKDCLESLRVQLAENSSLAHEVEVVIADNASTDSTGEVVNEYAPHFEHFSYIKNPENVGFDRNVDISVRGAHGAYCWYLGDDDAIIQGALSHIVETARESTYAVISVTDRPIIERPITYSPESYTTTDHIDGLSPSENYLAGYLPSALSMLIFRRDGWLAVADIEEFTTGWFYFETILKIAASENARVLHIKKPMILTGQDMRWADNGAGLKIFIDCNNFLYKMQEWGYDREAIGCEIENNARRFPIVLLQAKGKGLPITFKNFRIIRAFTKTTSFITRTLSSLLFFIPNPLVRLIRDFKKKLS